jgi:plastocyanin
MRYRIAQRVSVLFSVLGAAAPALAETHEVVVVGLDFVPPDVKIDVGDTVHWTWDTTPITHNVESGVGGAHDGHFRSGDPAPTGDFSVIFDQAFLDANPKPDNVYPYYCIVHVVGGMIGSVTVNKPVPTLSQWGLIIMGVLVVAAASIVIRWRRAAAA